MYSACLVCRHARKGKNIGAGQALCFLSFRAVDVHDVCNDFEPLSGSVASFHDAEQSAAVFGCRASTTATNSHKQEFRGEF